MTYIVLYIHFASLLWKEDKLNFLQESGIHFWRENIPNKVLFLFLVVNFILTFGIMFANSMQIFHEWNGDAFEGKDTTKYFLRLLLFLFVLLSSQSKFGLAVDNHGLNKGMLPLSDAVPAILEPQYELESKAARWSATTDIANVFFFSFPLAAQCRLYFAFM